VLSIVIPVTTTSRGVFRGASELGGGGSLVGGSVVGVGGNSCCLRGARANFLGTGIGGGGAGGSGAFARGASTTWISKGVCGTGLGRTAKISVPSASAACRASDVPTGTNTLEAASAMRPIYCCFSIWMANFVTPAPLSTSSK
jgi:hypothetical protein